MILQITIRHSYFGGQTEHQFYIGPEELEAGADITSHLWEDDRALFSPFTARYVDADTIELTCRDETCRYPVWEESCFESPWVSKPRAAVKAEGNWFDNDHEICASVKFLPHIQPFWDSLEVAGGDESALFPHELLRPLVCLGDEVVRGKRYAWLKEYIVRNVEHSSLRLRFIKSGERRITLNCAECPEVEDNGLVFSLKSESVVINEWDPVEHKPLSIRIDSNYLKDAETDGDAAYLLAESVQESHPEALEVIARYMRAAHDLGSSNAEEWLKDYLSDDGRFDAYC